MPPITTLDPSLSSGSTFLPKLHSGGESPVFDLDQAWSFLPSSILGPRAPAGGRSQSPRELPSYLPAWTPVLSPNMVSSEPNPLRKPQLRCWSVLSPGLQLRPSWALHSPPTHSAMVSRYRMLSVPPPFKCTGRSLSAWILGASSKKGVLAVV